jgi:exodeoxyribonuclease V gamma subunit
LHYRAASVKAKDRIKIWLKHLVYNIIKPDSYPANSTLIGTDSCLQYLRVENAAEILGQLLDLYWTGLHRPLNFFPDSSLNYAESVAKDQTERQALSKAIGTWIGSDNSRGESEDDYYKTCFGGFDPFDDMFKAVSLNIYRPLLKYQTKLG